MLTQGQKSFFDTFGYLVLREVFTKDEMGTIKRESEEIFQDGLGNRLDTGRIALQPFFERRPFLAGLVADDRIYSIGEDLLGSGFFLCGTEGNLHSGNTAWHGAGMWDESIKAVKIGLYTESLTASAGSLRVVPGSHRRGSPDLFESLRQSTPKDLTTSYGVQQPDIPCTVLDTEPGDLVVFTENILHSAFGGHEGRHQHAVSFIENPDTPSKEKDLRDFYESSTYSLRPSESYVKSKNPRIRSLVSKNLELGFDVMEGV